jgi:hypothetical protein
MATGKVKSHMFIVGLMTTVNQDMMKISYLKIFLLKKEKKNYNTNC